MILRRVHGSGTRVWIFKISLTLALKLGRGLYKKIEIEACVSSDLLRLEQVLSLLFE